jgi:hypothetical protein
MADMDNVIAVIQELQASQQTVMASIKVTRTSQEKIKSLMDIN